MLNKLIDGLLRVSTNSGFEAYCTGLHRDGLSGVPTVDEARREYRASILARDVMPLI